MDLDTENPLNLNLNTGNPLNLDAENPLNLDAENPLDYDESQDDKLIEEIEIMDQPDELTDNRLINILNTNEKLDQLQIDALSLIRDPGMPPTGNSTY